MFCQVSSVVKSCELKTQQKKAVWCGAARILQQAMYGDLSEEDVVAKALHILQQRDDSHNVSKDDIFQLSRKTMESAMGKVFQAIMGRGICV